ncbi:MAG: M48 family metalloprotease [Gemmatimonadaceae bacterium]|nr:M48 family metalloprotease [Gemmatimonadaceae bacterium]
MVRHVVVVGLLCSAAAGCAVSTQQEVQLGQQYAAQVDSELPIVQDAEINRYINVLGDSIARLTSRGDLDWHFYVVNTKVVNAFALPGGFIYVNRGIIERADKLDELAGVIGHEIGHVVKRHSVKQMQQMQGANIGVALTCVLTRVCESQAAQTAINVGGAAVFAKFSREDEKEADEEGVRNVVRAGISPQGMVSFFQKLLDEEQSKPSALEAWFSDHPLTQDRIADVEGMIKQFPQQQIASLTTDSQGFHAFKDRVAALPAPPPGQKQQP